MNQGERILGLETAVTRLLERSDNYSHEIKWLRDEIVRLDGGRLEDARREIERLEKTSDRRGDRHSAWLLGLVTIVAAVVGAVTPLVVEAIRHRVGR